MRRGTWMPHSHGTVQGKCGARLERRTSLTHRTIRRFPRVPACFRDHAVLDHAVLEHAVLEHAVYRCCAYRVISRNRFDHSSSSKRSAGVRLDMPAAAILSSTASSAVL